MANRITLTSRFILPLTRLLPLSPSAAARHLCSSPSPSSRSTGSMNFLRLPAARSPGFSLLESAPYPRSSSASCLPPRAAATSPGCRCPGQAPAPRLREGRLRSPRVSLGGGQDAPANEALVENGRGGAFEASLEESEDLGRGGEVFKKTLRLVECAMFASVSALAYLLSNSLAIEVGCGISFDPRRLNLYRKSVV